MPHVLFYEAIVPVERVLEGNGGRTNVSGKAYQKQNNTVRGKNRAMLYSLIRVCVFQLFYCKTKVSDPMAIIAIRENIDKTWGQSFCIRKNKIHLTEPY